MPDVVHEYAADFRDGQTAHVVNPDKLHAELKTRFGEAVSGLVMRRGRVSVCFLQSPDGAMLADAQAIVDAHDPDARTPEQQAKAAREERKAAAKVRHAGEGHLSLRELQDLVLDMLGE